MQLSDQENPFVFFYKKPIEKIQVVIDEAGNPTTEMKATGEIIDALFINIEIPGDMGKYNKVDRQVIEGGPECQKYAAQYRAFLAGNQGKGIDIGKIYDLGLYDKTAIEYLRKRGVNTLEQFAALPRNSLMSLLPQTGQVIQDRVIDYLRQEKDTESKQRIATMQEQINALQNLLAAQAEQPTARRRKQEVTEDA